MTIKLVTSTAGATALVPVAPTPAAGVTTATLADGTAAWGTTLHANPAGGFDTTETRFTGSTLSLSELASLGGRCAAIIGDGTGHGVCNSCRAGALGASPLRE